ncbi:hypothetical protein IR073_01785 [Gemella sp. 19428wG2_WT2a]|nr:hypothetical protein [Gemella sp. 19428wG2_WT2a]TFU60192.1 hypothetical protein E4T67_01770 [Gemella sp. WT2a]
MNREFISNIFIRAVMIIFIILMAINSFLVITKTAIFPRDYQETLYYREDLTILNIAMLVVFSIVILLFIKYIRKVISIKRLVLIVMIYVFFMSLLFALLRRDYVQFDPFNVIDQASNFIRDNYSGLDKGNNYLYIYSHQITTVFLFQVILGTFGRATFILYIMQSFAIAYIVYMLYRLVDIIFENEEVSYTVVVLSALCFPLIFYVAFIYGTLAGMFLVLVAFYNVIKYFKSNKWYHLMIAAFSINISVLFIGNNMINMLAIFAVLLIYLFRKFDKKVIAFFISTLFMMVAFKSLIINYYEVASQKSVFEGVNKISWIAMGMQEGDREAGWWNAFNYDILIDKDYDNEKVVEVSKNSINQRLNVFKNNPEYALDFYKRKYDNQFIDPTFQVLVVTAPQNYDLGNVDKLLNLKNIIVEDIYFGKLNAISFYIMKAYQIFVYIFTLIASFLLFRSSRLNHLFIPITFIGGTLFHIIWEAKSRYIFPYFVFLIPLAAYGFVITKNYLANKYYEKKEYRSNAKI